MNDKIVHSTAMSGSSASNMFGINPSSGTQAG